MTCILVVEGGKFAPLYPGSLNAELLIDESYGSSTSFVSAYTIVDYKLEQYFSLTPNQPAVLLAYNQRSIQPK